MLLALLAAAVAATSTPAASDTPATPPASTAAASTAAPPTAPTTAAAKPAPTKMKCTYETTLGSRLPEKVCRVDDPAQRARVQDQVRQMQRLGPFRDN